MIDPSTFFNIIEFAFNAYNGFGEYKWPIILVAMIGYVYLSTKSIIAGVVAILITFALVGGTTVYNIFTPVPMVSSLMAIITVIGLVSLVLAVLLKKEGFYSAFVKE